MTAEIINLNHFRKAKLKADKKQRAATNRSKFGRDKAEKNSHNHDQARHEASLDGNQLDDDSTTK
jgi:hypothetical protein